MSVNTPVYKHQC